MILNSFFTAAYGITVYKFMQLADVLCLRQWPLRHEAVSWIERGTWEDWFRARLNMAAFVDNHRCNRTALSLQATKCAKVQLPLNDLQRNLGTPFTQEYFYRNDAMEMYSYLFLYLSIWLWITILSHDLTLLTAMKKNYILDWAGVNKGFPRILTLFRLMGLHQYWRAACGQSPFKKAGLAVCVVFAPIMLMWSLAVFVLICIPMVMLLFIRHPFRLSRVSIFLLCMCFSAYGIILLVHTVVMLAIRDLRPAYAVTWHVVGAEAACICGCSYPLAGKSFGQIFLLASIVIFQGLMMGFRSLKGLRRSNWANLMSVTFAVPLTLYAVEWTRPNREPIRFRTEGEPVQGEPAFDPFALMDEQPDSAKTTVHLRPMHLRPTSDNRRTLEGPKLASKTTLYMENVEYVGCCGFPCRTGSWTDKLDSDDEEDQGVVEASATVDEWAGVQVDDEPRHTSPNCERDDRIQVWVVAEPPRSE